MEKLSEAMIQKVIPHLLYPLETEGRQIKLYIIHGNLWWGNAMMHADSDELMIFDAGAFWGHNEYKEKIVIKTHLCIDTD